MRTLTFNRVLGAGAMGTVYHAELRSPGGFVRTCAVKVMKAQPGPDHEQFMARMRDEARLLGMLQDEQILGVSELVSIENRDAVVMEFVEGLDLAELIKEHRVPPRALCELGAEMAGVLGRAHTAKHPTTGQALNVIHRDIKPANVMLTARGNVRLLDFGVARAAFSNRESQTQGLVLGTLNYFPPEVLVGAEPNQAVDIYGLGLTLWECATGKEWGTPQAQQKRFERRVEQRLEELPADYQPLVPILKRILQWEPQVRPTGAEVEKLLLAASDRSKGEGLRTWARTMVTALMASREKKVRGSRDELVGRTFEIGASAMTEDAKVTAPTSPAVPKPAPAPVVEARPVAKKRGGGGLFVVAGFGLVILTGALVLGAVVVVVLAVVMLG